MFDGEVTNRIGSLVGYFQYKIKMPKGGLSLLMSLI